MPTYITGSISAPMRYKKSIDEIKNESIDIMTVQGNVENGDLEWA